MAQLSKKDPFGTTLGIEKRDCPECATFGSKGAPQCLGCSANGGAPSSVANANELKAVIERRIPVIESAMRSGNNRPGSDFFDFAAELTYLRILWDFTTILTPSVSQGRLPRDDPLPLDALIA